MKTTTFLLSVLFVVGVARAQVMVQNAATGAVRPVNAISSSEFQLHHAYDVLRYDLYMDWYKVLENQSLTYYGIMKITFRPDASSPIDSINLDNDGYYLKVDSAFADGSKLLLNTNGTRLLVYLDKNYFIGDTGVATLYYHVTNPGNSNSVTQRGFFLYYDGQQLSTGFTVPHTLAYTMSEPSDAHYWMPCYDDPSDKALSAISIRVPAGFVAASNGKLVSTSNNHDGSVTYDWAQSLPISTYLMCATAAQFSIVQRPFVRSAGDTVPVQYYVYPEDSSEASSNQVCDVDSVVSMIGFYTSIFGDYPFDKYGMTCIEPFSYGGMEHTTITTLKRSYEFSRRVVAHELAHHWWGDNVTVGTWKDIWLNEGFATYSEAMQLQHTDEISFRNEMDYYADQFFAEDDTLRYATYAPPPGLIFGLAEYYKGAWALHMLRGIVGDSVFLEILRTYRSDFQFGNAVTSDFANVVNTVTGRDMNWFFDEWIYSPGYPVYSFTYSQRGDTLNFVVKQNQSDAPFFKMPIEIAEYSAGSPIIVSFVDSLEIQSVALTAQTPIDSIVFDPSDKILKAVIPWSDSSITPSPVRISNFPNPFGRSTTFQYVLSADSKVLIEIYDILGRKIKSYDEGYQSAGFHSFTMSAAGLASGAYLCRITTSLGNTTIKLLVEK